MNLERGMPTGISVDTKVAAKLFRGFADPVRLAILVELAGGEQRVTDLVGRLGSSQGNVSGHLACLKECGLVADRPQGRQVFYRIAAPEVVEVIRAGEAVLALAGQRVELCPNYRAEDGR
jgi:ArsR family transcriptional regulator, cadmium/lead-responsive transcriptional repressor